MRTSSSSSRVRRLSEPTPEGAQRVEIRRTTRGGRPRARARGPRPSTAGGAGLYDLVAALSAEDAAQDPAITELCIQATTCLVRAAATCEPRAPLPALCEAAVELVAALDATALRAWLTEMLAPEMTVLAQRAHVVVELATVRVRAKRFAELAQARQAYARGLARVPQGLALELASRALELVLDPFVPLREGLPRAAALAAEAAVASTDFGDFAEALASLRDQP